MRAWAFGSTLLLLSGPQRRVETEPETTYEEVETMSQATSALVDRFSDLVTPITDDFQCELVDVEYNNGVVKVVIDQPDGLLSQTLVEVTKAISRMIDAEDPIPGRFTLEVTSPGVERPLKKPEHFRRSIDEEVSVKTTPDVEGDRRVEGVLTSADEYGVTIRTESGERTLRYGEIRSARTVYAWGPAPKPGGKKGGAKAGATTGPKTTKGQLADER